MTAVLIQNRLRGAGPWVHVRGSRCVRIMGLESGDELILYLRADGDRSRRSLDPITVRADGVYDLPKNTSILQAYRSEDAGGGRVFVDLLRNGKN